MTNIVIAIASVLILMTGLTSIVNSVAAPIAVASAQSVGGL